MAIMIDKFRNFLNDLVTSEQRTVKMIIYTLPRDY